MRHAIRIAGFVAVPFISAVSILFILPIVSRHFGPTGWSSVALGQSIGAFQSVLCGLAWHMLGPNKIARSSNSTKKIVFAESILSRGLLFLLATPPFGLLAYWLAPAYKFEALLFSIALALNSLNASWFYSGTGNARYTITNEALVRLAGYLVCIPALIYTKSLLSYSLILILVGLVSFLMNYGTIIGFRSVSPWRAVRPVRLIVKEQQNGLISRLLTAAQQHLSSSIVAIVAPTTLPLFTGVDNTQRAMNNASTAYPSAFNWWIGSSRSRGELRRRIKILNSVTILLGVILTALWPFVAPSIFRYLFQDQLIVPDLLHFFVGLGIASAATSYAFSMLGLIPLGKSRTAFRVTSVYAILGFVAVIVGAIASGAPGAIIGSSTFSFFQAVTLLLIVFRFLQQDYQRPNAERIE